LCFGQPASKEGWHTSVGFLLPGIVTIQRERCKRSFLEFLSHTQILSETAAGPASDWIDFHPWSSIA
jgi:hypothetical protein